MEAPKVHHHHRSRHRRNESRSSARRTVDDVPEIREITENDEITEKELDENKLNDTKKNTNSLANGTDDQISINNVGRDEVNIIPKIRTIITTDTDEIGTDIVDDGDGAGGGDIKMNNAASAGDAGDGSGGLTTNCEEKFHKGIMGYMDREIKIHKKPPQSLSDPTASPAQRSTRSSRSSLEKSPRRKRSKSESRRRRERKLIAAGEMEVRQANETLMKYLKQCTEINDASLSGELEIDKSIEDRRVHRKTKSQRERRTRSINGGATMASSSVGGAAGGGATGGSDMASGSGLTGIGIGKIQSINSLTSILKDLSDDIIPNSTFEIYNPFTPVISPTDGPPTRMDRIFIQTPRGYRCANELDKHYFRAAALDHDIEGNRITPIENGIQLSCIVQRIWILIANICHGLLGGLAMAHLMLVSTTNPYDWVEGTIPNYRDFSEVYSNIFYLLCIICLVSVLDRMDICRISVSNASESISFKWIIIIMFYLATITLSLTPDTMNETFQLKNFNLSSSGVVEEKDNNKFLSIWNSLSIARSVCAIFGWILIGMSPNHDQLYDYLSDLDKYQITNN